MEPKELEELLHKVGGKYKLVTLYQRRMRELQRGLPKLLEGDSTNLWDIVSSEIMNSKVDLIMGEEAEHMRKELQQREAEDLAEAERKAKKAEGIKAPPPAAEAPHWTGFEVGGFGSVNYDKVRYLGPAVGENNELGPFVDTVIGGGAFAGVNVALYPSFVGGMEVSGNFQKAEFSEANGVGFAPRIFHFATVSQVYAVSVRLGWLATPNTLFYGKVGPAWLRVTPDRAYWNSIAPNSTTDPVTLTGVQYGGGAETFLTSNFSVRVEGLYTALTDTPGALTFQGVQPTPFRLKPALLSGTLGAGYHF